MPDSELDIHLLSTDPRLGRHVVHDPASRGFDLARLTADIRRRRPVAWARRGPIYDQSAIDPQLLRDLGADIVEGVGCCTMTAAYGLLMTEPFHRPGRNFGMREVLEGYHIETVLDERSIPGIWPPEDTGSAGLYAMKVLRRAGLITAYHHGFAMRTVLDGLRRGPVAVGTNWYDSMFSTVERDGRAVLEIDPHASIAGGHEWIIDRDDPDAQMVGMVNSWGMDWGDDGCAWLSYTTLERLLAEQGDAVQPSVPIYTPPAGVR